ncbi:MAG: hypothetical protein KGZ39_04715 [Simkania sp.]|nr:hypothetical protein [Simkania sp.]
MGITTVLGTIKTTTSAAGISFGATTCNTGSSSLVTPAGTVAIGAITLNGNASIDTTNGGGSPTGSSITFSSTINGGNALTLAVGGSNISFDGIIGGTTPLSILTISSANNVAMSVVNASSIVQSTGTGTTTFNGAIHTTGIQGISLTGTAFTMNAAVTTTNTGPLSISHTGVLAFGTGLIHTIDGIFSESGVGTTNLVGTINTNNQNISFGTATTLTGTATLNTNTGAGDIIFSNTVTGVQNLDLTTGLGNITLKGSVGAARLNTLTINTANNVTADALTLSVFNQIAGTGITTFNGPVDLNNALGLTVVTKNITFNNTLNTTSGGGASIQVNAGTLVLSPAATFTLDGAFTQSGTGSVQAANSITTTNNTIQFNGAVVLTGSAVLNTGTGIGDIVFSSTVDGASALILAAGTGSITIAGAVGSSTRLGALTIASATNVTTAGIKASSINQTVASTGTTSLIGTIDCNGSFGVQLLGSTITVNGSLITASGPFNITNSGTLNLTAGGSTLLGAAFTQSGGGAVNFSGTLTSNNAAISFTNNMTLTGSSTINSGPGMGSVTLSGTVDGAAALTIASGIGNTFLSSAVGPSITSITLNSANNITTQAITAGSISQLGGAGTTTFNGNLITNTPYGISLTGANFIFNGNVTTTGNGPMSINQSGTLTLSSGFVGTIGGSFAALGLGTTSLAGQITAGGTLSFMGPITVVGASPLLSTAATSQNIILLGTIDGSGNLTLSAGGGSISLSGAVGSNIRLGTLTFESALNVTTGEITAGAIVQSQGTGTTTFNGALNTNTSSGIALNLVNLTRNASITTTSTGPLAITNSGIFTSTAPGSMTIDGAFSQRGGGSTSIAGMLTTNNQPILFTNVLNLSNDTTLSSGTGVGDITLLGNVDGAYALTLTSGGGNILLAASIGAGTPLSALTFTSANNITATAINANSILQNSGTGITTFNGGVTTNTSGGISLTGRAFQFNNIVTTTSAGSFTLINSGTASFGAALNLGGAFTQTGGGGISLGANITTNNGSISFAAPVTLTGGVVLNSGAGSGNITLSSTVDGTQALALSGGAGNITIAGSIGASTPLASLTAVSNNITLGNIGGNSIGITGSTNLTATTNLTLNGTTYYANTQNYSAATNNINAGALTTFTSFSSPISFTGTVQLSAATNLNVNSVGGNITIGALRAGTNGGQSVTLNSGTGTISLLNVGTRGNGEFSLLSLTGGNILLHGSNIFTNAISFSSTVGYSIFLGGHLTTTSAITFPIPVVRDTVLNATLMSGGGDITFLGALDGDASLTRNLTIVAGTGNVIFTGAVGGVNPLNSLTISSASNITANAITAGLITQSTGTGTTTFNGALTTSMISGVNLTGNAFTFNNAVSTSGSGTVLIANSGTLSLSSGAVFTLAGPFLQTGSGGITLSGCQITNTTDNLSFIGPVTLTTATTSILNTAIANRSITFNSTIDGSGHLTMAAGTGNISLLANTGDGIRIGAFTVTSATNVIVQDLIAASMSITGFTGTLTLNGMTNTNSALGIILTGNNIIRNGGITTTNGGNLQTTNTGTITGNSSLPIDIDGSNLQLGTGPLNFQGSVIAHTGRIEYHANPLTLIGPSSFTSLAGSIQFFSPVNGTQSLNLSAGTDITFSGALGNTIPLRDVVISTARNVSMQALSAASITQVTGTGTTTFNGAISTTGTTGIVISNNAIVRGGAITTTNGGPLTLTIGRAGSLVSTAPGAIFVSGAITQNGTGVVNLAGTIGTTTAAIAFAGPITMMGDTSINTGIGPGGILLGSTVQGAYQLTLDAISGNITLGDALGTNTTPISSLTINHAADVLTQSIFAGAISQGIGIGTTTFNGALATSNSSGITLAGTNFTFNAPFTTTGGGAVTITNSGLVNIAAPGNIAGGLVISGMGASQLSSSIIAGDEVYDLENLGISGNASINTSAAGKLVMLHGTISGAGSLTLSSGIGDILCLQNITSLGALTIPSAGNVTMQGISAASITQSGVIGATIFNGDLVTSAPLGINISGAAVTFLGNVTAGGIGSITIANSGLLTTTLGKSLTSGGSLTQSGSGNVNLSGNLIAHGAITWGTLAGPNGAISLTGPTAMNTGGSSGITIYETIDGNFPLTLTAGTGDIHLNAAVGATTPIGAFQVVSVHDLSVGTVSALSITQNSGTGMFSVGTVSTSGALNTTGTNGITAVGNHFFRHGSLTTTNGGSVTITNSGTLTGQLGNTTSISGSYILNGTGSLSFAGSVTVKGAISFTEPITLVGDGNVTSSSGGITLGNTNNGGLEAYSLTINAGVGSVSLGAIGTTAPIGDIMINNASNITTAIVNASSFSAPNFTGIASFGGAVSTTNTTGIVLSGAAVSFNGNVMTMGSGPLTITNRGLLTIANGVTISLSEAFSQTGVGGTVSFGGLITSPSSISFAGPIVLSADSSIDTSSGLGSINIAQTINGAHNLTLAATTGVIAVQGVIGGTTPPTGLILQGSNGITLSSTMTIGGPVSVVSAKGTTTFGGALTASGDITLGVDALTLNRAIKTIGTGKIIITNSGDMILGSGAVPLISATTFTQSGGGGVSLGMNIISTGNLQFGSNILLTNSVTMDSNGGALTLANVDGAYNLTLVAGTGSMTLGTFGRLTPLTNVTIQSATNVTAGAMTGASLSSFIQTSGLGSTHFTGALSFGSGGISLSGSQYAFDAPMTTSGSGAVSITHSGLLTLNSGVVMNLGGAFSESGAGTVTTAAHITTSGQKISFANPITLSGNSALNSAGGDIILSNTVSGAFDLNLAAGSGFIQLNGTVNGLAHITASGSKIFQNSSISTFGAVQETGTIYLLGNITTLEDDIVLSGNVTVATSPITLSANSGNIHVMGTVNPDVSGRSFTALADNGSVMFDGAVGGLIPFNNFKVGGNTITMGNLGVISPGATGTTALTATTTITFTGTAYVNGIQNYTAGTSFNFNAGAPTTFTSSGKAISFATGTVILSAANDLIINSNGGDIVLSMLTGDPIGGQNVILNASTGNVTVAGMGTPAYYLHDVELTGVNVTHPDNIWADLLTINSSMVTTINANLCVPGVDQVYNAPVVISGTSITMTTGNLTFNQSLDADGVDVRHLTITTAGSDVVFNGPVGGLAPLGSITINPAADVTVNSTFNVGSLSQIGGTGTTSIGAGLTSTASEGININTNNIVLSGAFSTANGGPMTLANTGALTATSIAAAVSGAFTSGTSTISGNITTIDSPIQFTGGVTLRGDLALNSVGLTGANISMTTVDGPSNLTLVAGAGEIAFSGAIGGMTRLGRLVIASAGNVTASKIIKATSIVQNGGAGITTLADLDTNSAGGIQLSGRGFSIHGTFTTAAGGPLIITNSGNLSLSAITPSVIAGNLTQNGMGEVTELAGSFTVGGAISVSSAVTVPEATTLTLDTSAKNQNITFSNAITGPGNLLLNVGAGALTMSGNASNLGPFSVGSVGAITTGAIEARSILITATGSAVLHGNLTSTGAISLKGTTFTITGVLNAGKGFTINNSDILRLTTGMGSLISGGAFTQSGGGVVQLSGEITTVNQDLSFANAIRLEGPSVLSTSSGAGDLTLSSTIDGSFSLDLTAGRGAIHFGDAIGSNTQLGTLTIHSVNGITYPFVSTTSLMQLDNSGPTIINGPLTTTESYGISFVGSVVTQNGDVTALGKGPFSLQHSGMFSMTMGSTTTVTGGAYTDSVLSTGPLTLAGSILTTNSPISLLGSGSVTLGANFTVNTGAIGADITLSSAVNGAYDMTLIAHEGSIHFGGPLNVGNLTITSANNVMTNAITAKTITQGNGSGSTHFQGALNTNTAGGIALVGNTFIFDGGVTTTSSGSISITNTGEMVAKGASNWDVGGSFSQLGSGLVTLSGNITTGGSISFTGPVMASGTPHLTSVNQPITFLNTLDGSGSVTVGAGSGDITFSFAIGGQTELEALTIASAGNVTTQAITAASIIQSAGRGTSLFAGDLNTSGAEGINLAGTTFTFLGNLTTKALSRGPIRIDNSGTVTFSHGKRISSDGAFQQTGASVLIGGNLTTKHAAISFTGPITITASSIFNSGGGDITFSSSINGSSITSQNLIFSAGTTGNVTLNAIGQTTRIGALTITGYNVEHLGNTSCLSYAITSTGLLSYGTKETAANLDTSGIGGMQFSVYDTYQHGNLTTMNGGPFVTILSGGTTEVVPGSIFTVDGSYTVSGSGVLRLAGTLTTNNAPMTFNVPLILTGNTTLNSGLGSGDITWARSIDGDGKANRTLTASTGIGNAIFSGAIGATTSIEALSVTGNAIRIDNIGYSRAGVTGATALTAANLITFTGTTYNGGNQTYTGAIEFNLAAGSLTTFTSSDSHLTFNNGDIQLSSNTDIALHSSGGNISVENVHAGSSSLRTLTMDSGAGDITLGTVGSSGNSEFASIILTGTNITLTGDVFSNAITFTPTGTITAGGNITTVNTDLTFPTTVILSGSNRFTTGAVGGDIIFSSILNGDSDQARDLILDAGIQGNITFTDVVGNVGQRLNSLTIANANNVTANTINAGSLIQNAGTGTTTFNGNVNVTGISGIALSGNDITIAETSTFTTSNNGFTITNSGIFTLAGTLRLAGGFTQNGVGSTEFSGSITAGLPVSFATAISLSSAPSIDTSATSQSITFSGTISGPGDFILASGGGDITFLQAVGEAPLAALGTLTILSSHDVNVLSATVSSLTSTSTGTFTLNGTGRVSGNIDVTAVHLMMNGALETTPGSGGSLTINNSGTLTHMADCTTSIDGSYIQNGEGPVLFAGTITTMTGGISYVSPITLNGVAVYDVSSGDGDITFANAINGTHDLVVNAGSGTIILNENIGLEVPLNAVTITSFGTVSTQTIMASSINHQGSCNGTISGDLHTTGIQGISLSGTNLVRCGNWTSKNDGPITVVIPDEGSFTSIAEGSIHASGGFQQSGGGAVSISNTISTTNAPIVFNGVVTLAGPVTLDSGGESGDILFTGAIDGCQLLNLNSGAGDTIFQDAIGNNEPVGTISIATANNTTFQTLQADSLLINTATGTILLNGPTIVNTENGVQIGGNIVTFNDSLTTANNGPVIINNTGLLSINASCSLDGTGTFRQIGSGASAIGGSITTVGGEIAFAGAVTASGTANLTTSSQPITLSSTLDGPGNFIFDADAGGDITCLGEVGGSIRLGAVQFTNGNDISMPSVRAASITQLAGIGTTAFTGNLDTDGEDGIHLVGNAFISNGVITTAAGGPVEVTHTGLLSLAPGSGTFISGPFTEAGTGGTVQLSGNLHTDGQDISFANPITLIAPTILDSDGNGNIVLSNTIDGNTDIQFIAGSLSNIIASGVIGGTTPVNSVTITNAQNVSIEAAVTAGSLIQAAGTGTTSISAPLMITTGNGIVLAGNQFSFSSSILLSTSSAPFSITNSGPLSFQVGSGLTTDGPFSQLGTGVTSLATDIATGSNPVLFTGQVMLVDPVSITTATSAGTISFLNAVDGASTLALSSGQGAISFLAPVGATTPLTSFQTTGASTFTAADISCGELVLSEIDSLGTFNGPLHISGPISLTGFGFTFNDSITTTNTGSLTIANSGPLTIPSENAPIVLDGAFNQTSTGPVSIGGSLTTNQNDVTFQGPITLSGDLIIDTGDGAGNITIGNGLEGTQALTMRAGLGDVTCQSAFSIEDLLDSLTVTGCNITLNGVGTSTTGITGAIALSASGSINLTNSHYTATSHSYSPTTNANFNQGSLMSLTSRGPITFSNGGILLSDGSDLSIVTNNGDVILTSLMGSSPEDVIIDAGSGSTTLSTIGGGIDDVIVNAGEIYFSGPITAANTTFTSLGSIENLTVPVAIDSTNTATFNALDGNVGSFASPILVNTSNQIFVGATSLAVFEGTSIDNTVHALDSNPPCYIYFNGIEIKNCTAPPSSPSMFVFISSERHLFAVVGYYNSQFNLANDYFFLTYFLGQDELHKPIPVFSQAQVAR